MSVDLKIRAIGRYVPPSRCDTSVQAAALGVKPSVLATKLGFRYRAVPKEEGGVDVAERAVRALTDLHPELPLDQLGLLCVVTQNPDHKVPHTAATLHDRLSLGRGCMTFDLSQACAGYVHALAVVTALAARLGIRHALIVTADSYEDIVDPADAHTALIFGTAGTATWLDADGPGFVADASDFGTSPGSSDILFCADRLHMDGHEVFMRAVREVPGSIRSVLERAGVRDEDVSAYLLHPGSLAVVRQMRALLGLDEARCPFESADYGNTLSSSVPMMLADRLAGDHPLIVISGFGAGFSWGTCLLRWESQHVRKNSSPSA